MKLDVFDYSDYRTYLSDFIELKRSSSPGFSVRQLSVKAGISTDNYLLRVLRGQRNLGIRLAERFVRPLGLSGAEAHYFMTLVQAESAKTLHERTRCLTELSRLRRRRRKHQTITDNSLFRHWYIGAILELASCKDFVLTPKSASAAFNRRVSFQQAKEAIDFLVARKYLEERDGKLVPSPVHTASSDEISDLIVALNHRQNIEASVSALELPVAERGFYGLTLAVSRDRLPLIKEKLKKTVRELQEEFAFDPEADVVYRMNLNVFPVANASALSGLPGK